MDEYQRCKVRIYQYLMARGDSLKMKAEQSVVNVCSRKHPVQSDLLSAYIAIHDSEFFEMIYREILEFL